jgi:dipeptidyl aminopeptidase/acylaminoacyl peptidase
MRWVMMALAAMLTAGAAGAGSLETYTKSLSMSLVSISPDGAKVAFVQVIKGQQAVVIDQLNPAAVIANIPPSDRVYDSLTWVDPNHLIVFGAASDAGPSNNGTAQVVDLDKRKITPLLSTNELRSVFGHPIVREHDGRTTVFVAGYSVVGSAWAATYEAVDFATGKEQRLSHTPYKHAVQWDVGADGTLLSRSVYDEVSHVWTLQLPRGPDWIDVLSEKTLYDPPKVAGRTLDGKDLVVRRITDDHGMEFRRFSLSDGKLGELVPEYLGFTDLIYDPLTYRPIGGIKEGIEPTYVFFDPKDQALWDGIMKVFPDEEVQLTGFARDRSKAVVLVTGLRHGVSYQVVDLVTYKTMGIGPAFADVRPSDLADVRIAAYPTKDGLTIQALLTLPTGRELKDLPLIVLPHGGPGERDEVGYSAWALALASRGYAVLQPQFRGSEGLGWKLESAAFGELGRKMQTDLSDGVRALASKGYIDPKRVCIVGSGYGGYAALAGVMFEQGVYRCAVAIEPWLDLRKLGGGDRADTKHSIAVRNWERLVGAKDPNDPIFDRLSPAKHAADASAPILIMRNKSSDDDAIYMANALGRAKKSVELVNLDVANSWTIEGGHRQVLQAVLDAGRLQLLQAMVTFLEKNNPPR